MHWFMNWKNIIFHRSLVSYDFNKIGIQQSPLCYNLDHYKTNKYVNKYKHKSIKTNHINKNEKQDYKNTMAQ